MIISNSFLPVYWNQGAYTELHSCFLPFWRQDFTKLLSCPGWACTCDLPVTVFQSAGNTGMCHHTQSTCSNSSILLVFLPKGLPVAAHFPRIRICFLTPWHWTWPCGLFSLWVVSRKEVRRVTFSPDSCCLFSLGPRIKLTRNKFDFRLSFWIIMPEVPPNPVILQPIHRPTRTHNCHFKSLILHGLLWSIIKVMADQWRQNNKWKIVKQCPHNIRAPQNCTHWPSHLKWVIHTGTNHFSFAPNGTRNTSSEYVRNHQRKNEPRRVS